MHFFRVRSAMGPKELCRALEDADAIAIGTESVRSKQEVDLALHLAQDAFSRKTNIARKLKYEFILWLSGKRDIKRAMEATSPKEGEEFFVAVFSGGGKALKMISAMEMPLGLDDEAEPLRLEKISLSRIK